mgnify:CR=1 FL=1
MDEVTLIQTVGFPIAAYLLLYFDLRAILMKRMDKLEAKLDRHIADQN